MKLLICIPAVKNVAVTTETLDSVVHQPVDILLAQNGADKDIKDLFHWYQGEFPDKIKIIDEPVNIGVNPIWNKFLKYFLAREEYTHIGILSSDVIVHRDFIKVIEPIMERENAIPLPVEVDKVQIYEPLDSLNNIVTTDVKEGIPGTFIILNRLQAELVTPIPESIKLWFGDNWIFDICRGVGFKTLLIDKFKTFHHGSSTLQAIPTSSAQIEEDKKNWIHIIPIMDRKIKMLKQKLYEQNKSK